jgi:small subunit ribosomal protein S9
MMGEDERQDTPQEPEATEPEATEPEATEPEEQEQPEQPEAVAPPEASAEEEQPEEEQPEEGAPDEPSTEEAAPEEADAEGEPATEGEAPAEGEPAAERARPKKRERKGKKDTEPEVIPGEHLEPDLVLEEERAREEAGVAELAGVEVPVAEGEETAEAALEAAGEPAPEAVSHEPLDLAADARYLATGKRKSAVARVILRPGSGTYTVNGRQLDEFFPRPRLQKIARQPLETAGYGPRMDVVAKIHGGGVSSQAGALRHGIARALVEADPTLRIELKRRGYLTRDPRRKERKKAGLKKARKRPQFSKR